MSVGRDHDTPAFAAASIRHWSERMGRNAYPDATEVYIRAHAGGSNGYRSRVWKRELRRVADEIRLTIHVSHSPGTSTWNKIEHRLFSPPHGELARDALTTYETVVERIRKTRTAAGSRVRSELHNAEHPTGVKAAQAEMDAISLAPADFHAR